MKEDQMNNVILILLFLIGVFAYLAFGKEEKPKFRANPELRAITYSF